VSLVLDSSATLAWIYSDETTNSIRLLFEAVGEEGAFVPALWRLEIANSLTVAVGEDASMRTSAALLSRIWRSSTSRSTTKPTPTPGAKRYGWRTFSSSRCMTPLILNSPSGATFRLPHWTVKCVQQQGHSTFA